MAPRKSPAPRSPAGGAALALACIVTFVFVGKGTPAPFNPPRRLVNRGPYGVVRNPMYIGTALALAGAALFYRSMSLFGYAALFLLITHLFVLVYEEPPLRQTSATTTPRTVGRQGAGGRNVAPESGNKAVPAREPQSTAGDHGVDLERAQHAVVVQVVGDRPSQDVAHQRVAPRIRGQGANRIGQRRTRRFPAHEFLTGRIAGTGWRHESAPARR